MNNPYDDLANVHTEEELLNLWKAERPTYDFTYDGILCDEAWQKESPKIAFLLKESHSNFTEIRGGYRGPNGSGPFFWRNMNIWSYTVKEVLNGEKPTFNAAHARRNDPVGHVAYINIKKNHERETKSDDDDIRDYMNRDWEFIEKQISLIAPNVLFCGGTFDYVCEKLNVIPCCQEVNGLYWSENWSKKMLVIDFYHPSFRGYRKPFYRLKNMLESWAQISSQTTALPCGAPRI